MVTFTLDTNSVIAAAKNEKLDGPYVDRLVELARAGKIALTRTSGFEADQRTASPDQRRDNLDYLSQTPILKVPGPLRFGPDYEFFNGDVFTEDDTKHLDEQISQIVLGAKEPEEAGRRMIDVHHLTAHAMAGHDVFVTRDKHMINKRTKHRLRSEVGIVVKTPPEAVAIALGQTATTS
jgi:hypothetical protein